MKCHRGERVHASCRVVHSYFGVVRHFALDRFGVVRHTNSIMNVNYAQSELKTAALATDFGRELAQLWFGLDNQMLEGLVGRYSRGKRKGQLRGEVCWRKTVVGGWRRAEWGGGHVELPGTIREKCIIVGRGFPGSETVLEAA